MFSGLGLGTAMAGGGTWQLAIGPLRLPFQLPGSPGRISRPAYRQSDMEAFWDFCA